MNNIIFTDVSGHSHPMKFLFRNSHIDVLWFHDSIEIIPNLYKHGVIKFNSILYLSFSWYVSSYKARLYKECLLMAQNAIGSNFSINENITVLANSVEEKKILDLEFSGEVKVIIVNNTCLIDIDLFNITESEKLWNCVINAKPFAFKRLHLSKMIDKKVFITYDTNELSVDNASRVNITDFGQSDIYESVPPEQVSSILNRSFVGGVFSEEEGACYASTEYLLCGLPVVSTASRGGRDEFYDNNNSVISDASPEAVANSVKKAIDGLYNGMFTAHHIRKSAVKKILEHRENLVINFHSHLLRNGIELNSDLYLSGCFKNNGKLLNHRNFFISDFCWNSM